MVIYMARNIINNKMYIGKTVRTLTERKKGHYYDAFNHNSQTHFHRALRKYGKESFVWSILHQCETEEELNESEIKLIDIYKTTDNGYNMTQGGTGFASGSFNHNVLDPKFGERNPFYGKKHTIKTKKTISEKSKQQTDQHFKSGKDNPMYGKFGNKNPFYGKHHTPETLSILSDKGQQNTKSHFKTGTENPMFGKHLTDEHKQALSNASSKNWLITLPNGSQTTFKSLRKFAMQYNLNYNNVKHAKRKGKSYKGFTFSEVIY